MQRFIELGLEEICKELGTFDLDFDTNMLCLIKLICMVVQILFMSFFLSHILFVEVSFLNS